MRLHLHLRRIRVVLTLSRARARARVARGRAERRGQKERVEGVRKYDGFVARKKDEARDRHGERNEVEARADKNTTIAGSGESGNGRQPVEGVFVTITTHPPPRSTRPIPRKY